jgi:hypothetical protein
MIVIGAGEANEVSGGSSLSWSPDGQWLAMTGLSEAGSYRRLRGVRPDGAPRCPRRRCWT